MWEVQIEKVKKTDINFSRIFEKIARVVISMLLINILIALSWAVIKSCLELKIIFSNNIPDALKMVMVNSLTILALLEVFRTALVYFLEGRVKVTYIIDTVLVTILTEVMILWFKDIDYSQILMMIALILTLVIARILTIRFSPAKHQDEDHKNS